MKEKNTKRVPGRYAIWINLLIIIAVAIIGIWILYLSSALFTKHGQESKVPKVENMSYTRAVEMLHSQGFNVEIRDSLFLDNVKPGYVIEQFPKANSIVKPGRKIFLYINAVHPKEVIIDDSKTQSHLALKGWSSRQGLARLHELGFKNVRTITVLGSDDRIVKILANGKVVKTRQKVPVNAQIIMEISDGRLASISDSLYNSEQLDIFLEKQQNGEIDPNGENISEGATVGGMIYRPTEEEVEVYQEVEVYEEPEYYDVE